MWQTGNNVQARFMREQSRTVLVLGAGASAHLGFPLGDQLCDNIRDNTSDPNKGPFIELSGMGFTAEEIDEFHDQLKKSMSYSIDEFLSDRPKFVNVGRAAIAQVLIKKEEEEKLWKRDNNWYVLLRDRIKRDNDANRFSPVIVTFNYDLSLDKFLHGFLTSVYPSKYPNPLEDGIKIYHVQVFTPTALNQDGGDLSSKYHVNSPVFHCSRKSVLLHKVWKEPFCE